VILVEVEVEVEVEKMEKTSEVVVNNVF